ncbi:hypothetical protein [Myxosarcina sp. GI1]|uniref:hypothetical protein n=1 Tax=Myxosarcina sp. GI1 TaxID=1541065 RepID=UPI0005609EDA|nr:hypothetical protein [Myxosarcina sp. GI1]
MPLDWTLVKEKYGAGAEVPTVAGNKILHVTGADDEKIYIQSPLWKASLSRENLEKGVALIEEGLISKDPGFFVEDYKIYVADERATSVAHIFRDMGLIEEDKGFFTGAC